MSRIITVGAAQLGPIQKADTRTQVVDRMLALMAKAHERKVDLIVFPELALTTFFPRWYMESQDEVDAWFETSMPSNETQPLFEAAKRYQMAFHLGYAEKIEEGGNHHRYNTAILVDKRGEIFAKYRKVHLPGHSEYDPKRSFQHLEKLYFEVGDLGFPVWRALGGIIGMCICNDRRWPETYRVMGLQGVEMVVLGYNTPKHYPPAPEHDHLQEFHNHLVMQAGAYQNGTWVIGVAKAGNEEACDLIGESCIIAPTGEIVAECKTLEDEVIVADCDLDRCQEIQKNIFNFALHREPQDYQLICQLDPAKTSG